MFGDRTQMEDLKEVKNHVVKLIEKSSKNDNPDAAMKFAQAALNAANALCSLVGAFKP